MENVIKLNVDDYQTPTDKHFEYKKNQEPCIICERPVNITDKTKYVHYLTSSHFTNVMDHADSQGFFPIGNDCCKRLPKDFIFNF